MKSLHFLTLGLLGLPLPTSKPLDFIALRLLGLPRGFLCQPANDWISLLWGYWCYLRAPFANQEIFGFHCLRTTRATSGLPFPTSKSLDFIALGLLGLPLLWVYRGYLGATTANQQIHPFYYFGATEATLGLPSPTSKSLEGIAM